MHDTAHNVMVTSVSVPFELNQLLNCARLEDGKLLGLIQKAHKGDICIEEGLLVLILWVLIDDVLTDSRKDIDRVLDFVDFAGVNGTTVFSFIIFHVVHRFKFVFMENLSVMLSDGEDRIIVWSKNCVIICVRTWPFIKVELKGKHITVEEGFD
jgi:hypothetical protein